VSYGRWKAASGRDFRLEATVHRGIDKTFVGAVDVETSDHGEARVPVRAILEDPHWRDHYRVYFTPSFATEESFEFTEDDLGPLVDAPPPPRDSITSPLPDAVSKGRQSNDVALVVGVEKYGEGVPEAPGATHDAEDAREYFDKVLGLSLVRMLTDRRRPARTSTRPRRRSSTISAARAVRFTSTLRAAAHWDSRRPTRRAAPRDTSFRATGRPLQTTRPRRTSLSPICFHFSRVRRRSRTLNA